MYRGILIILLLNVACRPHLAVTSSSSIDSCFVLNNRINSEWHKAGEIIYKVKYSPTFEKQEKLIYYRDSLNISEIFKNESYKKCFLKMTQDSIVKLLGITHSLLLFDHIDYLIEKPCIDTLDKTNWCNLTIRISIGKDGYVNDIRKIREHRID